MLKQLNISLYWKCQLAGWFVACIWWIYNMMMSQMAIPYLIINFLVTYFITCIGVTHLYRLADIKYNFRSLPLKKLVPLMVLATILLALLFAGLNMLINRLTYPTPADITSGIGTTVTGIRMMSIWVLAYHLYYFAQRNLMAETDRLRLQGALKASEFEQLKSQINPHFLFNALNTIKALTESDPSTARTAIVQLSDLLRKSLRLNQTPIIPLKEELETVNDYLALEKLRFEERLQFSLNIPADVLKANVPPMLLQTLVENAIKHGISKRKSGGKIEIEAEQQNGHLHFSVRNSGQYNVLDEAHGIGLKNLSNRIALMYGEAGQLKIIEDRGKEEVLVSVQIPAQYG